MNIARGIKAVAVALVGCIALSCCGVEAACDDIADRVVRLHIVAASDSEEDQAVKLLVRDAILQESGEILQSPHSAEEAAEVLTAYLPRLEDIANDCLRRNGSNDSATAQLCTMYFPSRRYETVTLPAGDYTALRISIGEAKGQNWWCVVFPPMCVAGASSTVLSDVLTAPEEEVVTQTEQYEVRLKVVEWVHALQKAIGA